eukprot:gene10095-7991_t
MACSTLPSRAIGLGQGFGVFENGYEMFVLSENESRQAYDLNLLDQLDVEDYLSRFQGLILTVCGLGMTSTSPPDSSDSMGSKCNSYMQLSAA